MYGRVRVGTILDEQQRNDIVKHKESKCSSNCGNYVEFLNTFSLHDVNFYNVYRYYQTSLKRFNGIDFIRFI